MLEDVLGNMEMDAFVTLYGQVRTRSPRPGPTPGQPVTSPFSQGLHFLTCRTSRINTSLGSFSGDLREAPGPGSARRGHLVRGHGSGNGSNN